MEAITIRKANVFTALIVFSICFILLLCGLSGKFKNTNNTFSADESESDRVITAETKEPDTNAPAFIVSETITSGQDPVSSTFWVKFLDVGQADAALVQCDGHYMLIDGGNKADSSLIYSVLKSNEAKTLDLIVCTHPHEDHVGGLAGALNYAASDITLCPRTSYDSKGFKDFKKYADLNGNGITIPNVGDTYTLGSASVKILAVNSASDINNSSIVLRITYGDTSFLFAGDAEREAEQVILHSDYAAELNSTVLKVGHHGSTDAATYPFLREVMPQIAIISVGDGNSYGHPTDNTLSRLRDVGAKVYRTDMQGDILCISDGKQVTVTVEKNQDADTLIAPVLHFQDIHEEKTSEPIVREIVPPTKAEGHDYVLNTNTHKFHNPECKSVKAMKDKNRLDYHGTRDSVIRQGYEPCKNCNP